ncbi:MAG: biotin/lipoyl-binding protein [Lachnospiraceae bacterium]|nr:biotin/lipoyl-binding protein [Lachnospiraceae bacterium]
MFPTAAEQEIPEYSMVTVTRTDIVATEAIGCIYSGGTDQIELAFNNGGLAFKHLYVKRGDPVLAGDLLAELDTDELKEKIYALEQRIAENELTLAHESKLKELEINTINTRYKNNFISTSTRNSELQRIEEEYSAVDELTTILYYDKLEYEALCTQLENSRIYSPVDGLVTYIAPELDEPMYGSIAGDMVLGVSEYSVCTFRANSRYRSSFKEGELVTLTLHSDGITTYDATVRYEPSDSNIMYLDPVNDITDLEYGSRAVLTLLVENRQDVLAVKSSAIRQGSDFHYVYYLNDSGYRDIKIVEIGAQSDDGYTEIISGLEFGETIIQ